MLKKIVQIPTGISHSIAPSFVDNKASVVIEKNEHLTPGQERTVLIFKPDSLHKEYTNAEGVTAKIYYELLADLQLLFLVQKTTVPKQFWANLNTYPNATRMLNKHYVEHHTDYTQSNGQVKPWYPKLIDFMKGRHAQFPGPVQVLIVEGPQGTVDLFREFCLREIRGKTEAEYDYKYYTPEMRVAVVGKLMAEPKYKAYVDGTCNLLHSSATLAEAKQEVRNVQNQLRVVRRLQAN